MEEELESAPESVWEIMQLLHGPVEYMILEGMLSLVYLVCLVFLGVKLFKLRRRENVPGANLMAISFYTQALLIVVAITSDILSESEVTYYIIEVAITCAFLIGVIGFTKLVNSLLSPTNKLSQQDAASGAAA